MLYPMLTGLRALLFGSPLKLAMVVGNRLATWTGMAVVWLKLKGTPDRFKRFLLWGLLLNVVSLSLLAGAWWVFGRR